MGIYLQFKYFRVLALAQQKIIVKSPTYASTMYVKK